jgi:hypothetical protein
MIQTPPDTPLKVGNELMDDTQSLMAHRAQLSLFAGVRALCVRLLLGGFGRTYIVGGRRAFAETRGIPGPIRSAEFALGCLDQSRVLTP